MVEEQRLGTNGKFDEIKKHLYFKEIDWVQIKGLLERKIFEFNYPKGSMEFIDYIRNRRNIGNSSEIVGLREDVSKFDLHNEEDNPFRDF